MNAGKLGQIPLPHTIMLAHQQPDALFASFLRFV
jgi:hypothetical protein